jgi:hypothetical protein
MVLDKVWTNMPPDPEIMELEKRRAELKDGRFRIQGHEAEDEIRKISGLIRTKRWKCDKKIQESYRKYYFHNRPIWDVER